jgi:hypothetical protein
LFAFYDLQKQVLKIDFVLLDSDDDVKVRAHGLLLFFVVFQHFCGCQTLNSKKMAEPELFLYT